MQLCIEQLLYRMSPYQVWKKIPISPWLITLLRICGVIPTPISPETPRWYCQKLHAIAMNSLKVQYAGMVRVVHDVLRVFQDVSQCFTSVSWCFTMFNNVLGCLVSRAMIGTCTIANNENTLNLFNSLTSQSLIPIITKPSQITDQTATLMDT